MRLTSQVLRAIGQKYGLIVANLADGDVLGHTQNRAVTIACPTLVYGRLGQVVDGRNENVYRTVAKVRGRGQIVSGLGRGIALDRDRDYNRTRQAYDALVFGSGKAYRAH